VITSGEARPFAACVPVEYGVAPTSHVRPATIQIRAPTTLTEVVGILPEETVTINNAATCAPATCAHSCPFVSSVRTLVPEKHPSRSTMFKHLESHKSPRGMKILIDLSIAPAMQAVVVDGEPIVDPQLASIIRNDTETVMRPLENS
jgi:hypothetical protein